MKLDLINQIQIVIRKYSRKYSEYIVYVIHSSNQNRMEINYIKYYS